jgi:hypothetical protein
MPDYPTYLRRLQSGEEGLNPYLDFFGIILEDVQKGYARFLTFADKEDTEE